MQGDEIARLVIHQYDKLPNRGKPLLRSNGVKEWTILAGIVIRNSGTTQLECVSLATGVKALPNEKLAHNYGKAVHDSHAEILAIRAFNRYVIANGCDHIAEIYLYVSTPPCGDASMSLLNGTESWDSSTEVENGNSLLRGRAHFNLLGRIRTKPGRQDSATTMSKSCSDKLCLRQTRGLLLSPARCLFNRTLFLSALVCPLICSDFERAFARWQPTHPFAFAQTSEQFHDFHPHSGAPAPTSLVWFLNGAAEVVVNGLLQGSRKPSSVSRLAMVAAACEQNSLKFANFQRYCELKSGNSWPAGWIRTQTDDFVLSGR